MLFRFVVDVETERTEGKFESRDSLSERFIEELESADPGEVEGENEGKYEVVSWEVSEEQIKKGKA